ncbi:DNA mismatch endonuclease Vsr [Agrobacterium sp. S2]|nr:DNA mismatch endonuclease Vsr [Agrobacterium sp. S2]
MVEHPEHRSWTMSRVKSKDTTPEMIVRRLAHNLGYRYRLHGANLPGKPDLVFACRRKVIFVHGCYWHGHDCRRGARTPSTRQEYWLPKLARNKERDARNVSSLEQDGWSVLIVWECEISDRVALADRLTAFLGEPPSARG